ncbi:tetrathionate reductase [Pollutimonas nitritireducens]|uniref:Tetrathionate reductase n=1 Tax=Pollutimonas nitritireducens TaxID=2045209 RepID=A0A2N4UBK0_9BURK|nr:NrfD/PsrC family molybdoenzyme membrane anchor subunit [Pollutimonas nitritireducens]PLC52388.1 tetrathionate reductase [Pollutimonas nitritireducens]
MEIIELLTPHYEVAWLPWAVQYFFLVGIATCAALIAAGCAFAAPASAGDRLLPAATVVLAVAAIAAPVSLLADLHQPGRFWHFYAHFTSWSWMSLGAVLLPAFVGLALAFCAAWWFSHRPLLRVLGVLLAAAAISVLVYSGSEVMVLKSRPLWSTPFLPVNFALTAWLAALGAMLLVARWLPGGTASLPGALVRGLIWAGIIGAILTALSWMATGMAGEDASFTQAQRLFAEFPAWRMSFLGSIVAGLAIIMLMSCAPRRLLHPFYSLTVAGMLLSVGWVFRWIVFMEAQEVPKYGAGLYLYSLPLGSDGLLGMAGVLGLCIALIAIATWLVSELRGRRCLTRTPA